MDVGGRSGEMEVLVRVAQEGSLSAAARTLGMTPSAVSKLVARLEARLLAAGERVRTLGGQALASPAAFLRPRRAKRPKPSRRS